MYKRQTLTYDEFMLLGDLEMIRRFTELEEESEKAKLNRMQDNELEYVQEQTEAEHKENANKAKEVAQTQATEQAKDQYMKVDGKELPFR